MKLFFSAVTILVGSLLGYGGSYFYDTNLTFTQNKKNDIQAAQIAEKTESINTGVSENPEVKSATDEVALTISITPSKKDMEIPEENDTDVTVSISPTTSLTPAPTFIPSSVPTQKASSEGINGYIEKYAVEYNVDPHVLRHIATCESGFDPSARNKQYAGLFQFSPSTWRVNRSEMGEDTSPDLRYDAKEAVQTAAYMLSVGKRWAWPVC